MRRRRNFVNGDYYVNPNAGPLWLATSTKLVAETRIVPASKLQVNLNEEGMDHFFSSLIPATPDMVDAVRNRQKRAAEDFRIMMRRRYEYQKNFSF